MLDAQSTYLLGRDSGHPEEELTVFKLSLVTSVCLSNTAGTEIARKQNSQAFRRHDFFDRIHMPSMPQQRSAKTCKLICTCAQTSVTHGTGMLHVYAPG